MLCGLQSLKKCDEVMRIFAEEMAAVSHADTDTDFTERERERDMVWWGKKND